MNSIQSVGLTVQGSQLGDLGPSFNGTAVRTKVLLTELISKKKILMDKQLREKQRHRHRGNSSPNKQVQGTSSVGHLGSMASISSYTDASPYKDSASVFSKQSTMLSLNKSNVSVLSPRYPGSIAVGSHQIMEDQNMTLFSANTHLYCKKSAQAPLLLPLNSTVPVIFPHYEPKKVTREVHSKAFKDKIAEVMLMSTQYGRIERPYLFSLLRQSGGASNLQIKTMSGQEIIAEGYRKLEEQQRRSQQTSPSVSDPLTGITDTDPEASRLNLQSPSLNRRIAFSNTTIDTNRKLPSTYRAGVVAVPSKPIFDVSEHHEVLSQAELETRLGAQDQERLAYQLQKHIAAAKHEEHFLSREALISARQSARHGGKSTK